MAVPEANKLTFQLQFNPRTKEHRYKAMLDGKEFVTGDPNVNKFSAWLNVLAAVKKKNWENSPLSKLFDKIEKGTASDAELAAGFDISIATPRQPIPNPSVAFGLRARRPRAKKSICPENRHQWRDITTQQDRSECLHRKQCSICGFEDVIDSSD